MLQSMVVPKAVLYYTGEALEEEVGGEGEKGFGRSGVL